MSEKIDWYRVPLDREVLRELTRRSDARGLAQAGAHLGLVAALGLLAEWTVGKLAWPWVVLAFFLHGTVLWFLGGAGAFHELCHGTPFRTRWLNEVVLRVVSFLTWSSQVYFRTSHVRHHQYTGHHPLDLEVVLPGTLRLRDFLGSFVAHPLSLYRIVGTHVRHALGVLKGEWETRIFREEGPARQRELFRWARVLVLGHLALAGLLVAVGRPILIPLFVTPFWGGWLAFLCAAPQHFGLEPNVPDWRRSCRTVLQGPLTRYLYWNMNYHTEHHMYAAVPFYNLPRLHAAVAHDCPPPNRGLPDAWREMVGCARHMRRQPGWYFDPYQRGR